MRDEEDLFDITFACEGRKLNAHKLVLYSCSPYFKDLLKDNHSQHPIFFFHDISYDILKAILEYMYLGEVHITNDNLKDFIRVAEALQIRGLSKDTSTTVSFFSLVYDKDAKLIYFYRMRLSMTRMSRIR